MSEMTSKTVTFSGKEDMILALPLIREALHAATAYGPLSTVILRLAQQMGGIHD